MSSEMKKPQNKYVKAAVIIFICTFFLVSVVLLAVLALYLFFSQIFTTDIRLILTATTIALIVADVYLFSLKLNTFSDKIGKAAKPYRQHKLSSRLLKRASASEINQQPNSQPSSNEQPSPLPPEPLKPPVFEKKESVEEKKSFKPVFGPSSEFNGENKN